MDVYKRFKDRIKLTKPNTASGLPFEANIEAYKQWEAELPILDTHASISLLIPAVEALLSTDIAAHKKIALIEAAQDCLCALLMSCKDQLKGANLPLQKQHSELSDQLLVGLDSFTNIYLQIICSDDFSSNNTLQHDEGADKGEQTLAFPNALKSLVIFRAIELLSAKQLLMSLIYQSPLADFWNTVNALYELSEGLQLQKKQLLSFSKKQSISIETGFKRIHFLNLAGVNRFRRGDIVRISTILELHGETISINSSRQESGTFKVDLASCSAVCYLEKQSNPTPSERFFNTEKLIAFMLSKQAIVHEQHGAVSLLSDQPKLIKKVIRQLIPSWSTSQSRQSPRHAQTEEVTIYPGFESIFKALILIHNPESYQKKTTNNKAESPFNLSDITLVPIDNSRHHQHLIRDDNVINNILKKTSDELNSSKAIWAKKRSQPLGEKGEKMSAKVHDASLQGLHFMVTLDNKPLLKVTDLIGIQTKNEMLQLAIIRRLNKLHDGNVSVGVEMMSPNLKIASIKSIQKDSSTNPVIFLQGIPSINQADAIISPALIDEKDIRIMLKVNHKTSEFSLGDTIETNRVFNHYTVLKKNELD